MKLGIKDKKIYDICSDLRYKRDDSIEDKNYLDLPMGDWIVNDTWDVENKESLKDSPQRFEEKTKTEVEIEVEELKTKMNDLENRILELELKEAQKL